MKFQAGCSQQELKTAVLGSGVLTSLSGLSPSHYVRIILFTEGDIAVIT